MIKAHDGHVEIEGTGKTLFADYRDTGQRKLEQRLGGLCV